MNGRTMGLRTTWRSSGRIARAGVILALLAAVGACGDDGTQEQRPRLEWDLPPDPAGLADYLLDFELVPIGSTATRSVLIRNTGGAALALESSWPSAPFFLGRDENRAQIPVGGRYELLLSYKPGEEKDTGDQTLLTIKSNELGPPSLRTIRLTGKGVLAGLDCEPAPLEFGRVVKGKGATRQVSCTNTLEVALDVKIEGLRGNHAEAFAAAFASGEEDTVRLSPQGAVELVVDFRAGTIGRNDAILVLKDVNDLPLAQLPLGALVVSTALQPVEDGCLDFGYVSLGEEGRASLRLENIGTEPVRVTEFRIPAGGSPHFSVVTAAPLDVSGGEAGIQEVEIAFHPQSAGLQTTALEILTEGEGGPEQLSTCLSGFGGGPTLACSRDSVDFGQVALGLPVVRSIRCLNDGYAPAVGSIDNLQVEALTASLAEFQPVIRNPDGSVGGKAQGYAVGEEFAVEITYAPNSEQVDEGMVRLETNAGAQDLRVMGEGRDLPPCAFTLIPPTLHFGSLERGDELVQDFGIRNEQETACLVHDLHLTEGSDPVFSLEPIESAEIPGGETLSVAVKFAPLAYRERYEGKVVFQISSETDRLQEVRLIGSSAQPCLIIRPTELDFGKAMPSCETQSNMVTVSNVCGVPIKVTSIEMNDSLGSDQFDVVQRPTLPVTIAPNFNMSFTMVYRPQDIGVDRATVAITAEQLDDPILSRLIGEGVASAVQTDEFEQPPQFKSDILWVIDNSTSFDPFQRLIADNLPAFLVHARTGDYRMAVTTSGLLPEHFGWGDPCPGGAGGGEDGRFFPIDGSHPRILTPQTPNLDAHWRHNMMVGACHALEEPIEAALRALTPPLINNVKDPRYPHSGYDDGNAGFLREEADLAIIFVTDQMDHSFYKSVNQYLEAFRAIKGPGRTKSLKVHAITIPPTWSGLPGCGDFSHERSDRIMYLVEETGGTWVNICGAGNQDAWEDGMREMSQGTFGFTSRFSPRGIPGDRTGDRRVTVADLEVRVDGELVEPTRSGSAVWTYDPAVNAVNFSPLFVPAPGSAISITYQIACSP